MVRSTTLKKVPKIKKLLASDTPLRDIKSQCKCGENLIRRVQKGEFDVPHVPQKPRTLTPPISPPISTKLTVPKKRRTSRTSSWQEEFAAFKREIQTLVKGQDTTLPQSVRNVLITLLQADYRRFLKYGYGNYVDYVETIAKHFEIELIKPKALPTKITVQKSTNVKEDLLHELKQVAGLKPTEIRKLKKKPSEIQEAPG